MRIAIFLAILLLSLYLWAQPEKLLESNQKGLEILRKSLATYGGTAATDSFRLAFRMNVNKNIQRGQSLVAYAPFEPYYAYYDFMIDRPRGIDIESRKSAIAGGFVFQTTSVFKNGKGFRFDPVTKLYSETTGTGISSTMSYLPQNTLREALKNPMAVRYFGEKIIENIPAYIITCVIGGLLDYLYIDKNTNLVLKKEQMFNSGTGEEVYEFYFRNPQKIGGVIIPGETEMVITNPVYGRTSNTYTFSDFRKEFNIDSAMLKLPEGYKLQDYSYRKKFEVRKLAGDIYLLENITSSNNQWSYNVLFAIFDNYVLVAEAPLSSEMTERVISKIKETAPGKPIKYLVQSHHHDDHLGGIRGYIAEGTTIITTRDNVDLIQKIAKVKYNATPDRLARNPKPVNIEIVKNKKHVISDANHQVEIYDIGPNPHANEMIILYFPKEKLIYEADLINKGEYPLGSPGFDFLKKIKTLNLQVEKIASLHGQVVEKEEVEKLLSKGSW